MALAANKTTKVQTTFNNERYGVGAGAIHIYKGALLNFGTDGYLKLASDTSGEVFAGVALEELNQAAGGTDGDNEINIIPAGSNNLIEMKTGTIAVTDIGKTVYTKSDDQVELAATTTNDIPAGVIRKVLSTTSALVQI